MKKVEFSNIQRKAIETRNTDILVSAGAGSGKTTVLVERVLNLIAPRNGETPINIDRLLVVTFTDAAAQHMKDGVATALNRRIKENPNDENLKKQLALINKSNITTIHSFCLMVARKFFHKIDMESNFKVADTAEISLLKSEILDDLFEENYQKHYEGGGNINFIRLAQMFDQRVGDSNFRQAVLDLHEYALSASNPEGWLTSCAAEYLINDGLEHSKWYQYFIYDMQQKIDAIIDAANKALELAEYPYINTKYHDIISQEIEYINKVQIALSTDFESFCNSLNFSFDRFPGGRQKSFDDIDPDEIKAVRENITSARNIYKKNIAGIKNMIVKGSQGIENDLKNLYEIMLELTQIVSEFARRFRQEKKERGRADFNDFEHFALQILVDTFDDVGNAVLSKEAEEIGAMFDEVFIDEYQDSSLIQEAILNAVVKSGKINRFMVGDVKQCIYQFRMARPSIF
ncbi:MAG: UvrD-helicase domain-containing protein, partial [Defluviitaleaceae bacterium]|nr:UvrD-helicase domain-containing protein [Defluviitaleaceae bacterium]